MDVLLKPGEVYIKYINHPFPFGPNIGKLKFIPMSNGKVRTISLHEVGRDSTITFTLKNKPVVLLIPESEYDCDVVPSNPSALEHKTTDRFLVGAGHTKIIPIY